MTHTAIEARYPRLVTHMMVSLRCSPWGVGWIIKWHRQGIRFHKEICGTLCPTDLIRKAITERHAHKGTEEMRWARMLMTFELREARKRIGCQ